VGDNTYLNLQEVLLAGKTVRDLTNAQLVYLLNAPIKLQVEGQLLMQEYGNRLVDNPEAQDEDTETGIS
jgi:hypothetical protein